MFKRAKEWITEVAKKALDLAFVRFVMRTLKKSSADRVGAYSAQIAFYILMTVFPMVILFLQLIRVAPISQESILYAIDSVFPDYLLTTLHGLLQEVYSASTGLVPITIVTMLWTTSKVMHAMTQCLDTICSKEDARNWYMDTSKAASLLGFVPKYRPQDMAKDMMHEMMREAENGGQD